MTFHTAIPYFVILSFAEFDSGKNVPVTLDGEHKLSTGDRLYWEVGSIDGIAEIVSSSAPGQGKTSAVIRKIS